MIQHRILVTSVETGRVSRIFHLLPDVFLHFSQGSFILHHGNPQPAFLGVITYNPYTYIYIIYWEFKASIFHGLGSKGNFYFSKCVSSFFFKMNFVRPDRVKIYAVGCV